MREGSAEVTIACPADAAFAWLADPRNAGEWFASVTLPAPPARPLRVGATWNFSLTRQRGRVIPIRLATYQPRQSFTWETAYPGWRDNLQWTLAFTPAPGAADTTHLRMTIRQRPGPLGWPALLLAALLTRFSAAEGASMAARAERAAQRAGEALEAAPTLTYDAERHAQRGGKSGRSGRGGKRPSRP
jgi:uncharacterized protein YndB with AHSA1/START domain